MDGVTRQIGASTLLIKMDGDAYGYHRDPQYFFKNFADTIELTKEQLFSDDTMTLHNPGRLFIKLPRLEEDYYYDFDDGICYYGFDTEYTLVEAGEGFFLDEAYGIRGKFTLKLMHEEKPQTIDPNSGKYVDPHFVSKEFVFTYPDPLK